jgi:hypothetical protein
VKIDEKDGAVRLQVYVQPRAAQTQIVGMHGDSLKIRIAAPPVEGEANAALERFIAKLVGIAKSNVSVTAGGSSRLKTVSIENTTAAAVEAAFDRELRRLK